ncbi:hypothetical protein F9Z44_21860 (plasmid) [Hydrogenophaga sp. PBL-H3]|nr:hypothetical protein F9Z45_21860 [Hydrogenophaga sp. PBL-H3]QHE83276.1 hypothetical protein F9Z44_21860 [Hydrogenophaga sp. PBL-H3]
MSLGLTSTVWLRRGGWSMAMGCSLCGEICFLTPCNRLRRS